MEELISKIYCFFDGLFGQELAEYLWGYNCETEDYTDPNSFGFIGVITLIIALVFAGLYYYFPVKGLNHPRSNSWWNWGLILLVNAVFCGLFAYYFVKDKYSNGMIGDCMEVSQHAIFGFGLTNTIIATLEFIVLSFLIRRGSVNCRRSPF